MRKPEPLKIKLFDLLLKINVYEQNRFMKFVRSPYFNETNELVDLLDFYLPFFKKEKPILLTKEQVWKAVFPKKQYNDIKFRRFNSDLSKLAEQFLAQITFEKYPSKASNHLLHIINERDIDKLFHTAQKSAINAQQKWQYRNADFHYQQYKLEIELHSLAEKKERTTQNILPAVESLDIFYLSEKLRLYCTLLTYKNVMNVEDEILFINEIMEYLKNNDFTNIPAINIYYLGVLTLLEPQKEENYYQFYNLLAQHSVRFPPEEARNLYIIAQNFCIKKVNAGETNFLKELLKLYKELINNKLIFKDSLNDPEVLSPWTYKNIITVSLRVGELDWALEFIENFKNHIPETFRQNAYIYNLSKYHFYLKNYDEVISLLINVDYQGVFYMLDAKSLLLKTYYETGEDAPLTSLMDSFKVLLNRKKTVSANYRKIYKNLIKFTKKLRTVRDGGKLSVETLEKQLEAEKQVADISWLREKIAELKISSAKE